MEQARMLFTPTQKSNMASQNMRLTFIVHQFTSLLSVILTNTQFPKMNYCLGNIFGPIEAVFEPLVPEFFTI